MKDEINKGGAPNGNTNAEKWDLVTTEMFFDDILKYVQSNPKYIMRYFQYFNCLFILLLFMLMK